MKDENKIRAALARANSLTEDRRKEIATKAAEARWGDNGGIPKSIYSGPLSIGDTTLDCSVLDDDRRILTATSVFTAFGRTRKGMNSRLEIEGTKLPPFLAAKNLEPYINQNVIKRAQPIFYKDGSSSKAGYEAALLPEMCEIYLRARRDKVLVQSQEKLAFQAEILLSALA